MKIILACPVIEGYGQTEHVAGGLIQQVQDPVLGHVGGCVVNHCLNLGWHIIQTC